MCPRCHRDITVNEQTFDWARNNASNYWIQFLYCCNNQKCKTLFITESPNTWWNIKYYPSSYIEYDFSPYPNIVELSPNFKNYYNQAYDVEQFWHKDIAWPWYRKSIEFLIKDYAVSVAPDDIESIKSMTLQSCINQYILDDDINAIATRAYWLWNDQTHYYKRWEEHDIDSLKELIELTIHFLEKKIKSAKIIAAMPAQ